MSTDGMISGFGTAPIQAKEGFKSLGIVVRGPSIYGLENTFEFYPMIRET